MKKHQCRENTKKNCDREQNTKQKKSIRTPNNMKTKDTDKKKKLNGKSVPEPKTGEQINR